MACATSFFAFTTSAAGNNATDSSNFCPNQTAENITQVKIPTNIFYMINNLDGVKKIIQLSRLTTPNSIQSNEATCSFSITNVKRSTQPFLRAAINWQDNHKIEIYLFNYPYFCAIFKIITMKRVVVGLSGGVDSSVEIGRAHV